MLFNFPDVESVTLTIQRAKVQSIETSITVTVIVTVSVIETALIRRKYILQQYKCVNEGIIGELWNLIFNGL